MSGYCATIVGLLILAKAVLSGGGVTTVEGDHGSFLSPNYPAKYGTNLNIVYRAKLGTPGPHQIRLDYTVDLEYDDYIVIAEHSADPAFEGGLDYLLTSTEHISIPEYSADPEDGDEWVYPLTSTVYFEIEGSEFNMTIVSDKEKDLTSVRFNITFTVVKDIVVYGNSGSFLSPNYPDEYDSNLRQVYRAILTTPGPQQVRMDFLMDLKWTDFISIPELSPDKLDQFVWYKEFTSPVYFSVEGKEFNMTVRTNDYARFNITFTVLQGSCNATVELLKGNSQEDWRLMPITDMMTRNSVVLTVNRCSKLRIRLSPHWIEDNWWWSGSTWKQVCKYDPILTKGAFSRMVNVHKKNGNFKLHIHGKPDFKNVSVQLNGCNRSPSFWLRWTPTTLSVGHGTTVGSNLILNHTANISMNVRFFYMRVYGSDKYGNATFYAPFPDSYCMLPPSNTSPVNSAGGISSQPLSSVSVLTTSQDGPQESPYSTAGVISTERSSVDIAPSSSDVISTETSSGDTAALSSDVICTETSSGDIAALSSDVISTERSSVDIAPSSSDVISTETSSGDTAALSSDVICTETSSGDIAALSSDVISTERSSVDIAPSSSDVISTETSSGDIAALSSDVISTERSSVDIAPSSSDVISTETSSGDTAALSSDVICTESSSVDIAASSSGVISIETSSFDITSLSSDVISTETSFVHVTPSSSDVISTENSFVHVTPSSSDVISTETNPVNAMTSSDDVISAGSRLLNVVTPSSEISPTETTPVDIMPSSSGVSSTETIPVNVVVTTSAEASPTTSDTSSTIASSQDSATEEATTPAQEQKTNSTTTAPPPKANTYTREQRTCKCVMQVSKSANPSGQRTEQGRRELELVKQKAAETIKKDLTVKKNNVSANLRRKTSVADERTSSSYIGFLIALACFSPFLIIIVTDIVTLMKHVTRRHRKVASAQGQRSNAAD